jgi:hypothetical protein
LGTASKAAKISGIQSLVLATPFNRLNCGPIRFPNRRPAPPVHDFRPSVRSPDNIVSAATHANGPTMKDDGDKPEGHAGARSGKDPRQDRLKLALRENLKRRKSQARGRGDVAIASSNGDDVPPHDFGGKDPVE